jgi:hypothetical protein
MAHPKGEMQMCVLHPGYLSRMRPYAFGPPARGRMHVDNDHLMDAIRYAVYNHNAKSFVMPAPNNRAGAAVSGHGSLAVISFKSRAQSVLHSDNDPGELPSCQTTI